MVLAYEACRKERPNMFGNTAVLKWKEYFDLKSQGFFPLVPQTWCQCDLPLPDGKFQVVLIADVISQRCAEPVGWLPRKGENVLFIYFLSRYRPHWIRHMESVNKSQKEGGRERAAARKFGPLLSTGPVCPLLWQQRPFQEAEERSLPPPQYWVANFSLQTRDSRVEGSP